MFDHAIVYVPGAGGADLWIDATAEHARVGTLPAPDTNRMALVIRDGEKTLTRTPALRSQDNRQIETREFFLAEYGPARVVETTEPRNHRGITALVRRGPHEVAARRSQDLRHERIAPVNVNSTHFHNDFSKPTR